MPETKITNEQIATEVMGWKSLEGRFKFPVWESCNGVIQHHTSFLTDLNAAEMIIKKLYADGMFVSIDNDYIGDKYDVMFFGKASENEAQNKSLCFAICEAALKAVRS